MRRARTMLVALTLAVGLLAAACSSGGGADANVAKIAVIAPIDAGLVQFGRGIRNSVDLAVAQANAGDTLPDGWKLEVLALDDSSDPATGEAAAKKAAADPAVIGVVGTYNSGVAAQVVPVLAAAGIAMISPANTDPALTMGPSGPSERGAEGPSGPSERGAQGPDPANPVRPHANYFRMVAADNVQGPFLAEYAFGDLGAKRAAVVTQTKAVSKGLADSFSDAFTNAGGEIVSTRVVPDGTTDYAAAVREILPLEPDLLFYGGEYDVGSDFAAQAAAAGIAARVMGGDGLKDDAYITKAGPASDGDIASTVGAPAASLPSATGFFTAYEKAKYPDPPSDYGVYAYDAANALIAAAVPALRGADQVTPPIRQAVVAGVQATDVAGASGRVAFDPFGDTRSKVLTVYWVWGGAWKPVQTDTLP